MEMNRCSFCPGFVPSNATACPCCGALARSPAASRALRGALAIAGGSLFAATLSACYGAAYPEPYDYDASMADAETSTCTDLALDTDGDGHCGDFDCDEGDPNIHAGADDVPGDGIDQDCSGADASAE